MTILLAEELKIGSRQRTRGRCLQKKVKKMWSAKSWNYSDFFSFVGTWGGDGLTWPISEMIACGKKREFAEKERNVSVLALGRMWGNGKLNIRHRPVSRFESPFFSPGGKLSSIILLFDGQTISEMGNGMTSEIRSFRFPRCETGTITKNAPNSVNCPLSRWELEKRNRGGENWHD